MNHARTAAVAAGLAAVVLAGCTGGDTTDTASEPGSTETATAAPADATPDPAATGEPDFTFGEADVRFLQQAAPSHDQAVAVARLVVERTGRDDFRQLADDTLAFREQQLPTLVDLADEAGEPVDPSDHAAAGDAPSVVPDEEVAALEEMDGDAFDVAAAELLARLDEGFVTVADAALEGAEHPDVVIAAIDGIDQFEPEAETLRGWIADWGG